MSSILTIYSRSSFWSAPYYPVTYVRREDRQKPMGPGSQGSLSSLPLSGLNAVPSTVH
ncbi:hypothetical protein FA13DRAFT_639709 [Coprinellus micaceus]|uniref:Uncharacterized protein n=1 Tax=Coprinellus micaceus TaxID=71717 RepID=A0A4Y7T5T7_COPMI|nr:hypothetical protein FA13DRAFT_639709 [Coprinellus micaceus]